MADKEERFGLVMNTEERRALDDLARQERISQAAVLRRLIWAASQQHAIKGGQPAQPARAASDNAR